MSDPFTTELEEDPAADFLAREQRELAGLDDGFGGPIPDTTSSEPNQDFAAVPEDGLDFLGGSDISSSVKQEDFFGDTDLTSDLDRIEDHSEVNGDGGASTPPPQPQKILLWREEQQKKIAEKDQNEEVKMEEWRNTAKRELEEWYSRQAEQVEKHKKNNRVAEAEFVKERDETTPGNEWERISRLCDFNPKNNKNTKDVSKLRSILLQLKQNPIQRAST